MRTQNGKMYPHLFKNLQRVQNMRDELFSDVRTFLEVHCGAGVWLSSMWDSWQYLLLSEEEPEIRELFDRPRLPMINLYHFRWWPDLLDGCWPRGSSLIQLESSRLIPSVFLTPVTFCRIAAIKQSLFESCWRLGGRGGLCWPNVRKRKKQNKAWGWGWELMVFPTSVRNDTTAAALVFHKDPGVNYREKHHNLWNTHHQCLLST